MHGRHHRRGERRELEPWDVNRAVQCSASAAVAGTAQLSDGAGMAMGNRSAVSVADELLCQWHLPGSNFSHSAALGSHKHLEVTFTTH